MLVRETGLLSDSWVSLNGNSSPEVRFRKMSHLTTELSGMRNMGMRKLRSPATARPLLRSECWSVDERHCIKLTAVATTPESRHEAWNSVCFAYSKCSAWNASSR